MSKYRYYQKHLSSWHYKCLQQIPWQPAMESTIRLGGTLHAHLIFLLIFLLWGPSLTTTNVMEIQLFWDIQSCRKRGYDTFPVIQQVCNVSDSRVWSDIRCPIMNLELVEWHEFFIVKNKASVKLVSTMHTCLRIPHRVHFYGSVLYLSLVIFEAMCLTSNMRCSLQLWLQEHSVDASLCFPPQQRPFPQGSEEILKRMDLTRKIINKKINFYITFYMQMYSHTCLFLFELHVRYLFYLRTKSELIQHTGERTCGTDYESDLSLIDNNSSKF